MSDAATLPNGDEQFAVLVIGRPTAEQQKKLAHNVEFSAQLIGQDLLTVHVMVDHALYATPDGICHDADFAEYLRKFSQVLASNVVVRMVCCCDPRLFVRNAVEEVYPKASYEAFYSEADDPDWSHMDLSEIMLTELDGLRPALFNALRRAEIDTMANLVDKTRDDLRSILDLEEESVGVLEGLLAEHGLSLREDD